MAKKLKAGTFTAEVAEEPVLWRDKKRRLFFALPWSFTSYELTESKLRLSVGLVKRVEDDILLYRITDVTFFQTLGERMSKLGTLCVTSTDASKPEAHLIHIKYPRKVKDLIMQKVEEARKKNGVYTSEVVGGGAKVPPPPPHGEHHGEKSGEHPDNPPPEGGVH